MNVLTWPIGKTTELATVATCLKRLEATLQERLINWGYAICDAALRRYVDSAPSSPDRFPYPIGVD